MPPMSTTPKLASASKSTTEAVVSAEQKNNTPSASAATTNAVSSSIASFREMSLEDQNKRVFGNRSEALADTIAEYCQEGIQEGVRSLPLLSDPAKAQELETTIRQQYLLHVDILEAYADRNLFTLQHVPPQRRACLLHDLQSNPTGNVKDADSTSTASSEKAAEQEQQHETAPHPKPEEVPTKDACMSLDSELQALTLALQEAETKRDSLRAKAVARKQALATLETVETATQAMSEDSAKMEETVTTAVVGGQGLHELKRESRHAKESLESRQLGDDENHENLDHLRRLPAKRPKLLSLEESYNLERQVLGGGSVNQLSALTLRLKQSK